MAGSPTGNRPRRETRRDGDYVRQAAVGLAGGLLGAFAMNVFARAVSSATNGREGDGAAPGADRAGRGAQPPQADGNAEDDAAVRVGTAAYRALTNREPGPTRRVQLGSAAHYAFGGVAGVCYAVIANRAPAVTSEYGTVYGTAVWAIADEGVMPALGLSRGPRELPLGVHTYALGAHLVYGVTLEFVRRFLSGTNARTEPRRRSRPPE